MKLRFNDGTERAITSNPIEQKLFRNGEPNGWILNLAISGLTAEESNAVLTPENIEKMSLISEEGEIIANLTGYSRIAVLTIRHSETQTIAEIQFAKGV